MHEFPRRAFRGSFAKDVPDKKSLRPGRVSVWILVGQAFLPARVTQGRQECLPHQTRLANALRSRPGCAETAPACTAFAHRGDAQFPDGSIPIYFPDGRVKITK
jgi:hypothetical protein